MLIVSQCQTATRVDTNPTGHRNICHFYWIRDHDLWLDSQADYHCAVGLCMYPTHVETANVALTSVVSTFPPSPYKRIFFRLVSFSCLLGLHSDFPFPV